jgi:uncharacterized Zn-finger protein
MTTYAGSSIAQSYLLSPHDFTCEVLTHDTIKLCGLPWEPKVQNFVSIDVMRPKSRWNHTIVVAKVYTAVSNALVFNPHDSTLQVQGADFHQDDMVRVSMIGPEKAYCTAGDYNRTVDVNPVAHEKLVELACTGCGGTLVRPRAGGSVQCEYCGKPYYLEQVRA